MERVVDDSDGSKGDGRVPIRLWERSPDKVEGEGGKAEGRRKGRRRRDGLSSVVREERLKDARREGNECGYGLRRELPYAPKLEGRSCLETAVC